MSVKFIDLSQQFQTVKDEIYAGLSAVFEKSNFILGEEVKIFEEAFSRYCEAPCGVGVNSGTDAIFLTLKALGVGPGDEVIVPTFTFIATALGVSFTGAKPVFVDVEEDTCNLDATKLKSAISKRTKVIMPVHMYGQTADMDAIKEIAKKHKILVIEDACQAHGARYKGKRAGSLGDGACFSFYPTKGLGAFGDGGMVVTNNQKLFEGVRMLRDYGRKDRYEHILKGYNSRLDTVQAVVLSAKLKHLDVWNQMRAEHAAYYRTLLKGIPHIKTFPPKEDRTHAYQTFAVRVMKNRDQVCQKFQDKGIGVLIHYPIPLHLQKAYADLKHKRGDFPVAEKLTDQVVSLPMFPHMTKQQIDEVCRSLKESIS
ncbi:MAG TPA: DegT/DnrJ/EryC1/StrS family aminotransferase [Candidatus Omnitrophota bacterium]|nr:DegT/DnrJ/EryC1/StrS family aminotransferase [Candidatus Omnitrophota bacterium]